MDCGENIKEGNRQVMGLGLGVCGIGYHGGLSDKEVCEETADNNCGIFIRETNIKRLYSNRADVGFQYVPKVVGPVPPLQSDIEEDRVKDRTVSSVKN